MLGCYNATRTISLKNQQLYRCPKKIVPFSKIFLWAPDVVSESFIYQKLGNKSKIFLPYKDSIWADRPQTVAESCVEL